MRKRRTSICYGMILMLDDKAFKSIHWPKLHTVCEKEHMYTASENLRSTTRRKEKKKTENMEILRRQQMKSKERFMSTI
ncbi:unnamed protein product [Brassica oleracea]